MRTKKYKVVPQLNCSVVDLIRRLFRPAPSPDQANEIIWIVDLYEQITQIMPMRNIREMEEVLHHLQFKSFVINRKTYVILNHPAASD